MSKPLVIHAHHHCHALIKVSGVDSSFLVKSKSQPLTKDSVVLINAWEPHAYEHTPSGEGRCILMALYLETSWLSQVLRSLTVSGHPKFFPKPCATLPPGARLLANALAAEMAKGREISAVARDTFGHLDGAALLALWRTRFEALVAALRPLDAKARLLWYGPSMSARSFATARLMETWAHGQDIWDVMGRTRGASPGLRHITHLGVSTYGWTFVNRQRTPPQPAPYVELKAPDGELWTWGEPSATDHVQGPALDFALLVTQRRHRDDTALQWAGEGAEQWTAIAQCFAGSPADGPAPGVRTRHLPGAA